MLKKDTDKRLIHIALKEDIGSGDITTNAMALKGKRGKAEVVAKSGGIISGIDQFKLVFKTLSSETTFKTNVKNGGRIAPGDIVIIVRGPLDCLLKGERTAMNIISHLSGVSTLTAKFAEKIRGRNVEILDTRKTTPGMRSWEKDAVKHGGGTNHRHGLYDMYLVKENHISAVGGLKPAVEKALNHGKKTGAQIEIEVKSLSELKEILPYKPDFVLLDNFSTANLKKAVKLVEKTEGKILLEASGNINLKNIGTAASAGVDRISIGALTHSAPALDLSFRILD